MEACSPETRDAFILDLGLAEEEAGTAVVPKRSRAQGGHWKTWETFIANFKGINLYLSKLNQKQKLHFLQVFATQLRCGIITSSGQPISGRSVEDYLRTVGAEISLMVDEGDPRHGNKGLHPRID